MNKKLQEEILSSWISLDGQLKKSRITHNLTYNEAIVMKNIYDNYNADGVGKTSVQSLLKSTNILKSLMNRVINSLCAQGFIVKERVGRNINVYPVKERLKDFLLVHNNSLKIAEQVIDIVGEEDAKSFVRVAEKLAAANLDLNSQDKK